MKPDRHQQAILDQFDAKASAALEEAMKDVLTLEGSITVEAVVVLVKTSDGRPGKLFSANGNPGCGCVNCAEGYIRAMVALLGGEVEEVSDMATSSQAVH